MVASPQCPLLFHLAKAILVYELREQQPTLASSCAIATEPPITIASGQAELNLRKIAFGQGKKRDALQWALAAHRNSTSVSMVSCGRSSISQCPLPFSSITLTSVATRFICGLRIAALAFSPAIDRTGMVN